MSLTEEQIQAALKSEQAKNAIQAAVDDALTKLKDKNAELLGSVRELKDKLAEIEAAKEEAEEKAALKNGDVEKIKQQAAEKLKKETELRDAQIAKLTSQLQTEVIDKGLTNALVKAKIAPDHIDAVTALIKTQFKGEVGDNDGKPFAKFDGKAVEEFVTGWSQTDVGKRYVLADNNSGGGANGANGTGKAGADGTKKTMTRSAFEALSPVDRAKTIREVNLVDG